MVVIDQKIAFLGGLDICYGRWDNPDHSLTNDNNLWSGADFCNLRITDIYFPRNFKMCSIDPRTQPRMPWHDVAIQIRGNSVHDLARHFTTFWNFVTSQMNMDDSELLTISGRQTFSFRSRTASESERDNKVVPMLDSRKET
jgi:phospholipase D1/2